MPIRGTITLPGDKSISHRALMLASLTNGNCVIHNISTGKDVETTRKCLANCGINSKKYGTTVRLCGSHYETPKLPLNCGNSGTTVRLMAGLLAGKRVTATFIGDKSLSKRPMKRIIEPLKLMGAKFICENNKLPLQIIGQKLNNINYELNLPSAQVKSGIILAALKTFGITKIKEKNITRNHTEIMLDLFEGDIQVNNTDNGKLISIKGDKE